MNITILTHDECWKGLGPTVKRAAEAALLYLSSLRKQGSTKEGDSRFRGNDKYVLTIVLSNDAEVKTLNRDYRGKDKATNVLSFPDGAVLDGMKQLGDIILAFETIAREAQAQDKKLKDHVAHLAVHGVLHLLGFDHEIEKEAVAMERHEIAILKRMGIANPYETA